MDYKMEIDDMLKNLNERKKEVAVIKKVGGEFEHLDRKIKFLEYCLTLLETYQKELIFSVCINGISIRKYADYTGLSRNFIAKEKTRVITQFDKYFNIKFHSENI
ncbi:MAG: hypothetical protein PHC84_02210 [Clostridia bacterium]|nr:hypothetical protein [Clostridia bacterium]